MPDISRRQLLTGFVLAAAAAPFVLDASPAALAATSTTAYVPPPGYSAIVGLL